MKTPTFAVESPGNTLHPDFGRAEVALLPAMSLAPSGLGVSSADGPMLFMPVDVDALSALNGREAARVQVGAFVVAGGALLALVVMRCGHWGGAVVFEPGNRDVHRLFCSAQARGWLSMCLNGGRHARLFGRTWSADARNVHARLTRQSALPPTAFARSVGAALRAATALLMEQPSALRPRRLSLRLLASDEQMQGVIELPRFKPAAAVH